MKYYCFKVFPVILFCLSGLSSYNSVLAQFYVVDIERSKISWQGWKQLFGKTVSQKGNLKFKSGSFYKEDGAIQNAFLAMDMNSISHITDGKVYTDNDVVTHLKSESCFFVERYPDATFKLKKGETQTPENYEGSPLTITGTLIIKGITRTLSFPVSITEVKKSLTIKAAFQISRKAFDLDLEPFLIPVGGDRIVRDAIDVSVEIFAVPDHERR